MKTLHFRKLIGRSPMRLALALIPLMFACFALSPMAQAVVPAPDGGYPGGNTAEGTNALFSLTTGVWNTALGFQALYHDTTGYSNTATGLRALFSNTTGRHNVANGVQALYFNTGGYQNTSIGYQALLSNTVGFGNTANGFQALFSSTSGNFNTATGTGALFSNTIGGFNTASGVGALGSNTTGSYNTALGFEALRRNTTGNRNTANGAAALSHNFSGAQNTAIGEEALVNSTGSNTTALGYFAGSNVTTADNVIVIGTSGENVSNTCYIGNIFGVTSAGATAVYVNSLGKLGTVVSAQRFKDDIKPMDKASEAILALKPVIFRYKQEIDPVRSPQFGLVAEDVEKVNPDLVVRDREGKVNTVRYEAVNAMLLNEFLKAHRKIQEQEATISQLKKGMDVFAATLEQQAAQIQKVSEQIEASKPAPQVVNNP